MFRHNLYHQYSWASQIGSSALLILVLFIFTVFPAYAFNPPWSTCLFYQRLIINDVAKGAATLAVVALALGAMFGKVTWGMAILVAVGISGLFGAASLAGMAGGGC